MFRKLALLAGVLCLAAIGLVVPARADIVVPGADGSDGAFSPTDPSTVVDLSLAPTGEWNGTNESPGYGVYDPNQWAVVFRYTSVNIPSGKTVTFVNHPSRAPVVWLVSGSVTINGTVSLNGQNGHAAGVGGYQSEPGPGGFRGGRGWFLSGVQGSSAGFGPGGSRLTATGCNITPAGASYGTAGAPGSSGSLPVPPTYGLEWLLPLLGGSGGASQDLTTCPSTKSGSGAGGGAILIACAQTIALNTAVRANGGAQSGSWAGGGTGGGIRLVGDTIQGAGTLYAVGGVGTVLAGKGRIRLEANNVALTGTVDPSASIGYPGVTATLWPDANTPTVRVVSIGGVPAPTDPWSSFIYGLQDVSLTDPNSQTAVIEARHVPLTWTVAVRAIPKSGPDSRVFATYVSGDENLSTWHADLTFPNGFSAVQVRASQTPPPEE